MAKIISVSNKIYEELTKMKGNESYSILIDRLISEKSNKIKILSFFGTKCVDKKKIKELKGGWKDWSKKYV